MSRQAEGPRGREDLRGAEGHGGAEGLHAGQVPRQGGRDTYITRLDGRARAPVHETRSGGRREQTARDLAAVCQRVFNVRESALEDGF